MTKNSVSSIRNKSYWNFNNLNSKDPVALGLFCKDLVEADEKDKKIKKRKKKRRKQLESMIILDIIYRHKNLKMLTNLFWRLLFK